MYVFLEGEVLDEEPSERDKDEVMARMEDEIDFLRQELATRDERYTGETPCSCRFPRGSRPLCGCYPELVRRRGKDSNLRGLPYKRRGLPGAARAHPCDRPLCHLSASSGQPSSHGFAFANDEHEPQPEVRVERMPCLTLSVLDLVSVARVCQCVLGLSLSEG